VNHTRAPLIAVCVVMVQSTGSE